MDARTLLIIFIVVVASRNLSGRINPPSPNSHCSGFGRSLYTGPDPLHDHVGRWN